MRVQMRAEITRLHRRLDTTMIYVTHDQVEAMTMGDRICLMKDGRIQQVARPLDLYHAPANMFVASFIGSPPMNFFAGTIRAENGVLVFLETAGESTTVPALRLPISATHASLLGKWIDRPLHLGLRPEDIHFPAVAGAPAVSAIVETIERMGAESYIYLHTARHPFIVRTPATVAAEHGSTLPLSPAMEKARFFAAADPAGFTRAGGDLDLEKYHAACAAII
jgi:multiple sugar transport system ATP-binding protein